MTNSHHSVGFPDALEMLCEHADGIRLGFWWLGCQKWDPRERFLYGFALPSRRLDAKWTSSKKEASFTVADSASRKLQLIQRTVDLPTEQAHKVIISLREGARLADAVVDAGLPLPESELGPFIIGPDWAKLPTVFLSTTPSQSLLSPGTWGRTGLVSGVGCYCARHSPPNRMDFLADELQPDLVLEWVVDVLKGQTGVDFDRGGADALGSFEVFALPALGQRENELLSVTIKRTDDGSASLVRLGLPEFSKNTGYMAQVRTEQVNSISSDQLVEFDPTGSAQLTVPEPLDGILVRIWRRFDGGRWMLWDETERHFIRSVSGRGHIQGLSGRVNAPWLDKLPRRQSARAHALSKVSQVTAVVPMNASNRLPWERSILEARDAVRRAFPPRSEARFFGKGCGTNESKLQFAEWLKTLLSNHGGTVVVMDPYFDVLGLDLISRASGAAEQLVILTNTQVPSDDDEPGSGRAQRLTKATKQLWPILRGLNLKLYDLRSKGGGRSQLFHDRYLLLYDEQHRIEKGFNLSTSLQSAATTSPLLVTPIPADVLDSVADYVAELMRPDEQSGSELKELFLSSIAQPRVRSAILSEERARSVGVLLEQAGRLRLNSVDQLRSGGFFDGNEVTVRLTQVEWKRVRDWLLAAGMPAAAPVWDGLVESRLSDWRMSLEQTLRNVFGGVPPELESIFVGYLTEHGTGRLQAEDWTTHTRTLSHAVAIPFPRSVTEAGRFYDHHHTIPIGTSWPIHVAAHCLIQFFPMAVDRLVESLQAEQAKAKVLLARVGGKKEDRPSSAELEAASGIFVGSDAILSALVAALVDQAQGYERPDLPEAMKDSQVPFIRSLSAIAKLRKVQQTSDPADPKTFLDHLKSYYIEERREFLALAVGEYSFRGGPGTDAQGGAAPLPNWLVSAVHESFEAGLTAEELVALIAMCAGSNIGSRAAAIQKELLEPIAERNAISRQALLAAWDSTLNARLGEDHLGQLDAGLVQVWARAFWCANPEDGDQVLNGIRRMWQRASGTMTAPFLRHRNFDAWHRAARSILDCLLKVGALAEDDHGKGSLRQLVRQLLLEVSEHVEREELATLETYPRKKLTQGMMEKLRTGKSDLGAGLGSKAQS